MTHILQRHNLVYINHCTGVLYYSFKKKKVSYSCSHLVKSVLGGEEDEDG